MGPARWGTTALPTTSIDHDDHRSVPYVAGAAPCVQALGSVGTDDQEELVARVRCCEMGKRVGHIGRAASLNLEVGHFDAGQSRGGKFGHGEAIDSRGDRAVGALLPRVTSDHQQDSIERQHVPDFQGNSKVAHMGRIERPAQDTDPFARPISHGGECRPPRLLFGSDLNAYRLAVGFRPQRDISHVVGSLRSRHDVRTIRRLDRRTARNECAHGTDFPP